MLFQCLKKSQIPFVFVSAYFRPDSLKDSEFISLSDQKISNLKFLLKLFKFGIKLRGNDNIIHLHHPYVILPFVILKKNRNSVLTFHDNQLLNFKRNHSKIISYIYTLFTNYSIKRYKEIISDNRSLSEFLRKKINKEKQKINTINVPVNLKQFKPINKQLVRSKFNCNENQKILLFVGRLEMQKNPKLAIKIFKKVISINSEAYLWFVGSGSMENDLKEYVAISQVHNIKFIGNISQSDMHDFYNVADVLIVSSFNEGGPLTAKEALACNLPVVSTDVGDVGEVIEGIEGCYIAEPDADDFAEKIMKALSFINFESRSKIERYSSYIFGEKIVAVYKNLITKS